MKRFSVFLVVTVSLVLLAVTGGCSALEDSPGSKGINLPPEVAGIWEAQSRTSPFVIKLSPNGTVISATVTPGDVEVTPNKVTKVEMKDGSFGSYKVGDCPVEYEPSLRELTVEINVEHLYIPFPSDALEGEVKHVFIGIVSDDGTSWDTTWMEFFDYGPRFPMDPEGVGVPLMFMKDKN